MIDDAEIDRRHDHHRPRGSEDVEAHESIREAMKRAARTLREVCPPGRELALAFTKLEEARMWANAAVACVKRDEGGAAPAP